MITRPSILPSSKSSSRLHPSSHTKWLSMLEVSGPFLAVSVLKRIFPHGLESLETHRKKRIRVAYEKWREAVEKNDPQLPELHRNWIGLVLDEMLEYKDSLLEAASEEFTYKSPDGDGQFKPDFVLKGDRNKPLMFISIQSPDADLEKTHPSSFRLHSSSEAMTLLCRDRGIRLGLVTNGERWMLVNALVDDISSHISWYARLWFQEPVSLKAFQSLLGVRRWFGPEDESPPAILEDSLLHHEEVTYTLGEQIKRAIEVLVQCLDKADQDRNRELLHDLPPAELYEAGLTVMMRLVFLLCAEERGLLLLGDPVYDQHYAITTLRGQLAENADQYGHEVLEKRQDAWTRLLTVFRAVYGGIEQESLRISALGGSLFDPDRFPFLEGRAKGTLWQERPAQPLPIDNRTVLLLLESLQALKQRNGALLLSYKTLEVEQIGHIYEGLLEHTVCRLEEDSLGLIGSQKARNPNIALAKLESARMDDEEALISIVETATSRSRKAIINALAKKVDDAAFGKILTVCGGDMDLAARLKPFAHLLRSDAWGNFIVYRAHSFAVTLGADRRETGTHYTPKSLTGSIVESTLDPMVYVGPSEGKPRTEWQLKSSAELLELKICDPAMGSGAFLVQVCRYLSEKIVAAWKAEENQGLFVNIDGQAFHPSREPMSDSLDERLLIARRLVAEKCLYGVDLNPLAVELAKLSIWLITLAKGRPFGFLDHNLRSGDSLLGLHKLEQLTKFSLHPEKKRTISIFASNIETAVKDALLLRKQLRKTPIRDIRDVQYIKRLDQQARQKLKQIEHIADAMIAEALASGGSQRMLDSAMDNLSKWAADYIDGDNEIGRKIINKARKSLSIDLPAGTLSRKPFHWVLEFPEVFESGGFDGIVGNPPFAEGKLINGLSGYWKLAYEVSTASVSNPPSKTTKINLVSLFFEASLNKLKPGAALGLLMPTPFLRNQRYWRFRYLITNGADLLAIWQFPHSAFRSASVETCACILKKNSKPDQHLKSNVVKNDFLIIRFKDGHVVQDRTNISDVLNDKYRVIRTSSSSPSIELLMRLRKENDKIEDYYFSKDGINPGRRDFRPYLLGRLVNNYFVPEAYPGDGKKLEHELASPEPFDPEIHHKSLRGRDFSAYSQLGDPGVYLRYDEKIAYVEEFFVAGTNWSVQLREREVFDREQKVVTRQTASTLIATLDTERRFPVNNVHSHYPKTDHGVHSCLLLLAILNSRLLRFAYQTLTEETGKVFPQVHLSKIRNLPFPAHVSENAAECLEGLANEALRRPNDDKIIGKIDDLVFKLYKLTNSDIELVKSKGSLHDDNLNRMRV